MLVLCAYLSAMAGITALCYVFRKRQDEGGEGDTTRLHNVDAENKPLQSATGGPDILVRPPTGEKPRTKGRSALTPETQAKIQEVLDFVNTPSEQLVLETEERQSQKRSEPPLELPVYGSSSTKRPKEVIDDLKQSKAKVEAWISKLDKVINNDGVDATGRHEKRPRGSGSGSGSGSGAIKTNMLSVNSEARKNANSERLAKVKEEMAKRRTLLGSKAETKRREEEEKPAAAARKKWPSTPESGSGPSYKKEGGVEASKRGQEANTAARKQPSVSPKGSSIGSANTAEEQKTPAKKMSTAREEREVAAVKAGPSRGRPAAGRRAASRQEGDATEEKENAAVRARASRQAEAASLRAKTQTKPVSSFEVRMKYVPPGRQPRAVSPPRAAAPDGKTRSPQPASKIPVMVNSRVRPPVTRTARVTREQKTPAPVAQRPKKSIRITHEPPQASRRADYDETPPPVAVELGVAARRSSSHHGGTVTRERSKSGVAQDDTAVARRRVDDDVDADADAVFPELNIIDVRGSQSYHPQEAGIHAELHNAAREVAARIAKSGPIRLNRNNSFARERSLSIANLRGQSSTSSHGRAVVLPGQPVSVSKTVQLPQGSEDNVTVYFSVTMPRRANSDVNWNGHDDSDHTITTGGAPTTGSITEIEVPPVEEEPQDVGSGGQTVENSLESMDDDDHSDDGVFPEELSNFPDGSDNEVELDYQSSVSDQIYDGKEFDSCDEQF